MAVVEVGVFGTPITQGTRAQRAQAAAKSKNADGKLDKVLQFAHSQEVLGGAESVSVTSALVYNATGDPMTFVMAHNWEGHVAGNLPIVIQNGQTASFFHVGEPHHEGSIGAVVYNIQGYTDSMIAWNNPKKTAGVENITAYCEMKDPGYFNYADWNEIFHDLRESGTEYETSWEGFTTKVRIDTQGKWKQYWAEFDLNAG